MTAVVVRSSEAAPLQVVIVDVHDDAVDVWINENLADMARFIVTDEYRQLCKSLYGDAAGAYSRRVRDVTSLLVHHG